MYSGIVNGEPTTFGTSGMLYRSNKVMYDRATRSLWNQFIGEPVIGPLADSGIRQPFFPSVVTTWAEWLDEHPDTTVISRETGIYPADFYVPEDDPNAIYYSYFTAEEVMFPVWLRDDTFQPKAVVVGLTVDDAAKAYAVRDLQRVRLSTTPWAAWTWWWSPPPNPGPDASTSAATGCSRPPRTTTPACRQPSCWTATAIAGR